MPKPWTINITPIAYRTTVTDETEFVYAVKASAILTVGCPPWDPSLMLSLAEHFAARIEAGGTDDVLDSATLIDIVSPDGKEA